MDVSSIDTSNCTNLEFTFNAYGGDNITDVCITTLTGYENWDTSKVTSFSATFQHQSKLTSLDLTNWSFKNATDLRWMFTTCSGLKELSLGDRTNKATSLKSMFHRCSSLTELNVSDLCTSNCTNLVSTFCGCFNMQNLSGIETWDTSNVTSLANTFSACNALTSLDLSNWDTSNVTNMYGLFGRIRSIKDADM